MKKYIISKLFIFLAANNISLANEDQELCGPQLHVASHQQLILFTQSEEQVASSYSLDRIPSELALYIFSFLPPKTWLQLREVSKAVAFLAEDDQLWANHFNGLSIEEFFKSYRQEHPLQSSATCFIELRRQGKAYLEKANFDKLKGNLEALEKVKIAAATGIRAAMRMRCNDSGWRIESFENEYGLKELQIYAQMYNYNPAFERLADFYRVKDTFDCIKKLDEAQRNKQGCIILNRYIKADEKSGIIYILQAYNYGYFGLSKTESAYHFFHQRRHLLMDPPDSPMPPYEGSKVYI